ncbi:MAG TPA: SDR family NAD(P)-dependent oxidoreductase [Gemmatimonadaceae bacterium]|nr:SDR family NAD(P)-dependent oxidoreductase [Gemmatimonadaceae bacterium]
MPTLRFLITGGSQGIGAALVESARRANHQVVFTGRDADRVRETARATGAHGIIADVASADDNARTVDACRETMGGVDVLVNNAAYAYRADIGALDVDAVRANFDTNVFGLVDITNRVVPLMKAQGEGDIINIASTSGMKGAAGGTSYSGTKWAVRGITQCWQAELRPHSIRVVCVCPSEVQTNFVANTASSGHNARRGMLSAHMIVSAMSAA